MFFLQCGYSTLLSHTDPHVAELAETKRLYQGKVFEMDKLKQKLEESQESVVKVCIC